jgi:hypothetical protein
MILVSHSSARNRRAHTVCNIGTHRLGVTQSGRHKDPQSGDTHDVIHHGGQVVAVVVPIGEYQKRRQAMQEQQVNEEFDAAWARYLARREAGAIRYVSHEEGGRRLGLPSR